MRLGFDSTLSWASVEWMGRNSSKNIPSFCVLRIAMESSDKSVQYLPHRCLIRLRSGDCEGQNHFPNCSTWSSRKRPIGTETFHQSMKVIITLLSDLQ